MTCTISPAEIGKVEVVEKATDFTRFGYWILQARVKPCFKWSPDRVQKPAKGDSQSARELVHVVHSSTYQALVDFTCVAIDNS